MTTREIAEVAGVTQQTVRMKGKELFPTRFVNGKKTVFTKKEATAIMAIIRKPGFVAPTENLEVPPKNLEVVRHGAEIDILNTMAAIYKSTMESITKMTEAITAQNAMISSRISAIESTIDQRRALLPAPQIKPRDHVNKIVREYARRAGIEYNEAWRDLYIEYGYRTNSNPGVCARNRSMGILDYIETGGMIGTLEAIALDYFGGIK